MKVLQCQISLSLFNLNKAHDKKAPPVTSPLPITFSHYCRLQNRPSTLLGQIQLMAYTVLLPSI
jgi:hypothetical protein